MPWSRRQDGAVSPARPIERYVDAVFQALAIFRFFTFAMGAGLLFTLNTPTEPSVPGTVTVMVVGAYTVIRVLWRFNPAGLPLAIGLSVLASDLVLGIALVILTGGLDSPFLIYSLASILSASLLMNVQYALSVALASGLSVSGAYVAGNLGLGDYPWILSGNYLAFSLLYMAVCLLISYLPFLANLNWQRRLQAESQAAERTRLRREVHDSVAQTLAFLSLKMRRAEERASSSGALTPRDVADVQTMVERAYLSVRDYLDETQDGEESTPLPTGITNVVQQWSRDTGLAAEVGLLGEVDGTNLSPRVKFQLLQIVREALANVAKHSYCRRTWVTLEYVGPSVVVHVRDDGRGFPPSQPKGHGLGIMTERAHLVGASLEVRSVPGEGTEVVITYPTSENTPP